MRQLYLGQSLLTFELDTFIDISTASALKIHYTKPNALKGFWDGVLEGTTKIKYDVPDSSILDIPGIWKIKTYVEIGGKIAYGEEVRFRVIPI